MHFEPSFVYWLLLAEDYFSLEFVHVVDLCKLQGGVFTITVVSDLTKLFHLCNQTSEASLMHLGQLQSRDKHKPDVPPFRSRSTILIDSLSDQELSLKVNIKFTNMQPCNSVNRVDPAFRCRASTF